jgi:hypothetical protein
MSVGDVCYKDVCVGCLWEMSVIRMSVGDVYWGCLWRVSVEDIC